MCETIINITNVSPEELFGVGNNNLRQINAYFKSLKIIARGAKIKAIGKKEDALAYQRKIDEITIYMKKYGHISPEIIDQFCSPNPISAAKHPAETVTKVSDIIVFGNNGNLIKAKTPNQQLFVDAYTKNDLLFAIGPAGSGKTYTAIALAVRALREKEVKRIILTRPAVEAGEKLGFLPGDMKEKLDPYLQPLYDALGDMIPPKKLAELLDDGTIQIAPLAYMRGRTLDNACVILDEAQNTTPEQIKMFLTRMGRTAKFMVTGDKTQIDLPNNVKSGLVYASEKLNDIKGIAITHFDGGDILRHPLVGKIVMALKES